MYFIFENEAGIVGGGYAAYNEMREILREKGKITRKRNISTKK